MFDDGLNVVTMNLPKSVKDLNDAKEAARLKKIVEKQNNGFLDTILKTEVQTQEMKEVQEYEPLVRDYSIDVWNGSPGLHHWGYTNDKGDAPKK